MDIRAQKTRKALRKALVECMEEKPVKEIQVKEICQRAGLDRTTFYKHYKDVDELITELETEQLNQFRKIMESEDKFGEELIKDILNLIEENKHINKAARKRIFSDHFIDEMAEIAKNYAFEDWKKKMPNASDQEVELALTIMISAATQVIVNEADKYDSALVVKHISNLMNGCINMYE